MTTPSSFKRSSFSTLRAFIWASDRFTGSPSKHRTRLATSDEELGQPTGYDALTDATFALQHQMDGWSKRRSCDCSPVFISVRVVLCHDVFPFLQIKFLPAGSPSLWSLRMSNFGCDRTRLA